jgi:hypothetical protein
VRNPESGGYTSANLLDLSKLELPNFIQPSPSVALSSGFESV